MNIEVKYTMTAPVSHIGETASTGSIFQTIKTSNGRVPVITGNSIRGTLRDCAAKHLLNKIGTKVDKDTFNVLFSGGNIGGAMKDDVARAKAVREHFPVVSLLGGGLGDMMLGGKALIGFAYPICDETSEITGKRFNGVSWHSLIDEIEFTRTDDAKNDCKAKYLQDVEEEKSAKASTQMRYGVQYMGAGTEFTQFIMLYDNVTELELGALLCAFAEWFKLPKIGGMSNKGFGTFDAVVGNNDIVVKNHEIHISSEANRLITQYNDFISNDNSAEWLSLIAGGKNGKK